MTKNLLPVTLLLSALLFISDSALAMATTTVPEPSSLSLLGLALLVVGIIGRKKK